MHNDQWEGPGVIPVDRFGQRCRSEEDPTLAVGTSICAARRRLSTLESPAEGERSRHQERGARSHGYRQRSGSRGSDGEFSAEEERRPRRVGADTGRAYPSVASDEALREVRMRPELLQKTQELLEVYRADPGLAHASLLNAATVPEFPRSEWFNVLLGDPVDLDRVRSDLYTVEGAPEQEQAAWAVKTAGDWLIAWQRASEAYLFAFPHRACELAAYQRHIIGLFVAVASVWHERVIEYDRAVRKHVAGARTVLLSDFDEFAEMRFQHIQCAGVDGTLETDGAGSSAGAGERQKRRGGRQKKWKKKPEACRNWNAGRCKHRASQCRYRHVCSECGASVHSKSQCSKK